MEDRGRAGLEQAREAVAARKWGPALVHFRAAAESATPLSVEDRENMALSAWLGGESADQLLASACEAYEAAGRPHDAARVASFLMDYHGSRGETAVGMGWARRAKRVLESAPEGRGHARMALMEGFLAVMSGRIQEALDHVEHAHALARRHGDEEAEALALIRRARLFQRLGRIDEATSDADEAMLLVYRDRVGPLVGAMIYCNTIDFCRALGDFERALEWTEAAARWTNEREVCTFPGICRVHRAELLRLKGEHGRAEAEARAALEMFRRYRTRWEVGVALGELGLQRLEIGDLDGAADAFREAEGMGHDALPGVALLSIERGDASTARSILERALADRSEDTLGRAHLLPGLVRACAELGDLPAAGAASEELSATATRIGTLGMQAPAFTASARVHLLAGEVAEAMRAGRAAVRAWNLLGACYELAHARELLALAYEAAGDGVRAKMERERARATKGALSSTMTMDPDAAPTPSPPPDSEVRARPASFATARPLREGEVLDGKIVIGPVLGIGGMGVVHRGTHQVTGRAVAVKLLKRSACGESRHCERFLREARACGRVKHPNVVDIYDAGMHWDEPYIVMELLEGRSLDEHLASDGRFPLEESLALVEEAARGVAAVHEAGVVHRDLKPANVFLVDGAAPGRRVKVLDFGISKQPEGGETGPGHLVGTPFYMAPEQVMTPERVDARTDVWALGAVLFELLTGRPPFAAETVHAVIFQIANGDEPDLRAHAPEVPDTVEAVVRRALARDPDARFASAAELADTLAVVRETLAC